MYLITEEKADYKEVKNNLHSNTRICPTLIMVKVDFTQYLTSE